jgi:methyl-accepting chemotaxis protein
MRQLTKGSLLALLGGLFVLSSMAVAQTGVRPIRPPGSEGGEEMSSQDREILAWANAMASEITQVVERWISSRELAEERLFSRLYYPVPKTDPPKYTTDYDSLADRDLSPIQEKYLNKSDTISYAITTDLNGYVPTHNKKYSMPATGNLAVDLINNRSKRLFGDRTGGMASHSEALYLIQQYKRDSGELMADLSVPISIKGHHWGCVRIGYRRIERP